MVVQSIFLSVGLLFISAVLTFILIGFKKGADGGAIFTFFTFVVFNFVETVLSIYLVTEHLYYDWNNHWVLNELIFKLQTNGVLDKDWKKELDALTFGRTTHYGDINKQIKKPPS
ncbi:hypothetical protein BCD67_24730 [Oscillatoriales cyanobacterium USR001]|nr:hypothetical protein BCD67_24730 [Oscillatoriales cyanobacterium USR001]